MHIGDRQNQPEVASSADDQRLLAVISRHWGYSTFRPLQSEAMHAVLRGRDSLVVLPTGGGKSLCYQAPALLQGGVTIVVSPLISLMKDQVDGLVACGVAAAQLNSSLDPFDQRVIERDLVEGSLKLLFVSPERLAVPTFRKLLSTVKIDSFAIDEAHCISHWGHDFRPEYRMLRDLRQHFPDASIHGYTATATEQVRRDIVSQLALRDPLELVGSFDRPNLTYRVVPRRNEMQQIEEVLQRHKGEGGIIYCIRRRDVDEVTAALRRGGHSAVAYHAGLSADERKRAQDAFASERCDIVVATVAFGMGIDRSNVRFVLHIAMPKSIEHYQQESGRAGRDGLEAECVLLFGPGDVMSWVSIFESGSATGTTSEAQLAVSRQQLNAMESYCSRSTCRHRALVEHFGQQFDRDSCGACDVCLGDFVEVPDALVIAQKIISCVVRMREPFGMNQLIAVLRGETIEKVRARGHDRLSTFGLLAAHAKEELRDWIGQLIAARVLEMEGGRYPVVLLNGASREVLRGARAVRLLAPREKSRRSQAEGTSWAGVDRGLFEELRGWRKREAEARGIPPFVIFSDTTLRQLATVRPSTPAAMRRVYGVGDAKLTEFGAPVTELIAEYAELHALPLDREAGATAAPRRNERMRKAQKVSAQKNAAFEVFAGRGSIEEAAAASGRARSTALGYLTEWITASRPSSVSAWVPDERYDQIAAAAKEVGTESLRAIRDRAGEHCSYDEIHVVIAHLEAGDA